MRTSALSFAVHAALTASVFVAGGLPVATLAQEANPPGGTSSSQSSSLTELGTVTVVGTRIAQPNEATSQPVQILTNAQLRATGLTTVGQILQQLPSAGNSLNELTNAAGNSNTINSPAGEEGEAQVSLDSLGAQRTLVLVNGRRWVSDFSGAVDLNSIPLSMVDHIEILQNGASAIYGSDAVAGVVDIITKKEFNGATASAYYGVQHEGSQTAGQTQQYSLTLGSNHGNRGIIISIQHDQTDPIYNTFSPLTEFGIPGTGNTRGSSGTPQGTFEFLTPPTSDFAANGGDLPAGDNVLLSLCPPSSPGSDILKCHLTLKPGAPGTSPSDFEPYTSADAFNTNPQNYLLTPLKTTSVYAHGHYDFDSNVTLTQTVAYTDRKSSQLNAPMPLFFEDNNIDATIAANNPYNPFGFALNPNSNLILLARRSIEMGPRVFNTDTSNFNYRGQVVGDFYVGHSDWSWDVGYIFGESNERDIYSGMFNLTNLALAVGDPTACAAVSGCVPYNLFGGVPSAPSFTFVFPPTAFPGSITPAMNAFVGATEQNTVDNYLYDYTADITNPAVVKLPGGPLGVAFGVEHRKISGEFTPDALLAAGDSTSSPDVPVPAAQGEISDNSAYGEVNVPIVSKFPMAYQLSIDAAARLDSYDLFGSATTKRLGLKWQPIHDLVLRATYATGFRAPSLEDLFGGKYHNFSFTGADPCSSYATSGVSTSIQQMCEAEGVPTDYVAANGASTVVISGSNSNLKPERSISRTVGFVYSPSAISGLNINGDFYNIDISSAVEALNPDTIVQGCYYGNSTQDCSFLTRDVFGDLTINAGEENIGELFTEGVDGGIDYTFPFPVWNLGLLKVALNLNYVDHFRESQPNGVGGQTSVEYVGQEVGGTPTNGVPRYRANLNVDWGYRNWGVSWTVRYIASMMEDCSDSLNGTPESLTNLGLCSSPDYQDNALSTNRIPSITYHNVLLTYDFERAKTKLSLGVNNVFDKEPPISRRLGTFDPTLYLIPGRYFYASVSVDF
jgi:iron complex outermembrane recepter protein